MKKILIIEDDQLLGNVCYNHLMAEGFHVRTAPDGESGLSAMREFKPDMFLLDLILPKLSGLEVIKQIRSNEEFAKAPIVVFSNAYLTNLVQEAWKAGATKCISKANCSPRDLVEIMRRTICDSIRDQNSVAPFATTSGTSGTKVPKSDHSEFGTMEGEAVFQEDLRKSLLENLPGILASMRASVQSLAKTGKAAGQLAELYDLYRRVHALAGNAGIAMLVQIAHLAAALEALLKELHEKPENINHSTLRTVAAAVDFLGFLFQHGTHPGLQVLPAANILVVDDEAISRRAIIYALEKARLQSTNVDSPETAYLLLADRPFDLVFLDVDMPGMSGLELCAKLRALPLQKKTPVVFVTVLSDFDNRTSTMIAGGNDFIAKPFLFIELTVKALIHVLRGKLPVAK